MDINNPVAVATNLGGFFLVLPASFAVAAVLAASRRWKLAFAWTASIAIAAVGALCGKLFFMACPIFSPIADLHSPSGHTALATAFYPTAALLLGASMPLAYRAVLFSSGVLLALLVAIMRVATGAHSVSEVVVGASIGLVGLGAFALLGMKGRRAPRGLVLAPLLLFLAACTVQGNRVQAEPTIAAVADWIGGYVAECRGILP